MFPACVTVQQHSFRLSAVFSPPKERKEESRFGLDAPLKVTDSLFRDTCGSTSDTGVTPLTKHIFGELSLLAVLRAGGSTSPVHATQISDQRF